MRRLVSLSLAMGLLVGLALPAAATHTHVRMTGNGACVILAANGHEDEVELPHADSYDEGRRHPLHVNVHLGPAGMRQGEHVVWVLGSEAGDAACANGYVND